MLLHLQIKNYALIQELSFQPGNGLNIITGETGAGKSIMLGALGLLMGQRADVKSLFNDAEKCVIEGTFDLSNLQVSDLFEQHELDYETHSIIRREINPQGKSRAFINDIPVTLDILKELGAALMDIHSQHETLQLGSNNYQLGITDAYAQTSALLSTTKTDYLHFKKIDQEHTALQQNAQSLKKELEYNTFQFKELQDLKLEDLQQADLEEEQKLLENTDEIKRRLATVFSIISDSDSSIVAMAQEASTHLNAIGHLSSSYLDLKERLQSVIIETKELSSDIEMLDSRLDSDPSRLEHVTERLSGLYKVQKKHGLDSVEGLISLAEELSAKIDTVQNLEEHLLKLEKSKELAHKKALESAKDLSHARAANAPKLQELLQGIIREMGMPDAKFEIVLKPKELSINGIDEILFGFSANKGQQAKPLKDVASGGEFSRVMLALKYILAKQTALPTIIFDEIDTGISGEVANKVGKIMKEMSGFLQVIVITHLHQIASKGDNHYFVYKDNSSSKTNSKIKKLSSDERIMTIAQMIGGDNPSDSAIRNAIELLEIKL